MKYYRYLKLCLRYRMLITQQRYAFSIWTAKEIAQTYSEMERIAYE